ncbi:MAG: acetylglutamate kinase [Flavobacteriales bacterium]|jgi:acetylglutamate kinase|nr:acetylglutamate kinase [Candidatus Arcticimaribacter sp.]MBT4826582.1 acetylglutamate kinase [Flavobacteriaceae bacterium]MDG1029174.1 acetylglutamate kinase [Flavobacteriaceae bacterium]
MDKLSVVKIGGNVIEDSAALQSFLTDFAQMQGSKILVHGGGKKATAMAEKMDIPVQMVEGRRITDAQNLDIITMLYGGKINKNIVAQLQNLGCNALGLSGADGNAIQAVKRPVKSIDYGFVGDVVGVNNALFQMLLKGGYTPVCCAITHDQKGQLLNTNADTIAATLAQSLSQSFEVSLWYCFEKQGVLENIDDDGSVIETITPQKYKNLKTAQVIHSGMIPKIDNCFDALANGVNEVKIGAPKMIAGISQHTTLTLKDE